MTPSKNPPTCRRAGRAGLIALLPALLLWLAWAPPLAAQNRIVDLQSFYQTDLRALAMGNAFGPVARGEGALLYNPAGLAQYDLDVKIDVGLGFEGESGDFFSDTVDQFTGSPSQQDLQNYLTKYLGTTNYYRGNAFYNVVANLAQINIGLGAGVMSQNRFRFTFTDVDGDGAFSASDELTLGLTSLDLTLISFAFQVLDGQWLIGITLKDFTYKEESATSSFQNVLLNGSIDLATVGTSYDETAYDIGMIWRLESLSLLRAQWSLVTNNMGGITLRSTDPAAEVLEVPATYNLGFMINPELPWSPVHLIVSAELEDVTGEVTVRQTDAATGTFTDNERSTSQRMHLGAELGVWETSTGNHILNLRLGSHRGLTAYGIEVNVFSGFRLLYTKYEDDFGHEGASDEHTFEAIQLSIGFGF